MEFLNSIELRGIVGIARQHVISDKVSLAFSLLTEYAYKDDGAHRLLRQHGSTYLPALIKTKRHLFIWRKAPMST